MLDIPPRLTWLAATPAGAAWLDALPDCVAELTERWSLTLGDPFTDGYASFACPVQAPSGPAVLKVQFPHRECRAEPDALRAWDGAGAVRLLDHDPVRHALLLERCRPGTPLTALAEAVGADAALDVVVDLLARSWVPVEADGPFDRLDEVARAWLRGLPDGWEAAGRPIPHRLVAAALELGDGLAAGPPPASGDLVLINQDLHPGNVLAAAREPWLAIDPKPLAGERAFGLAPVLRSAELGHSPAAVIHRLDRLAADLDVDRERARAWAIVHAVAWSLDAPQAVRERQVDTATWLLDRR